MLDPRLWDHINCIVWALVALLLTELLVKLLVLFMREIERLP